MTIEWLQMTWIRLVCVGIIVVSSIFLPSLAFTQLQPTGKHIFCLGKFPQAGSIESLASQLADASISTKEMFQGNCLYWTEDIDGGNIELFVTEKTIWLHIVIEQMEGAELFLDELLQTIAAARGLPAPQDCHLTNQVGITITNPGGAINMASIQVNPALEVNYYQPVLKAEVAERYGISESDLTMELGTGQVYWVVPGKEKVPAMSYHQEGKEEPKGSFGCSK